MEPQTVIQISTNNKIPAHYMYIHFVGGYYDTCCTNCDFVFKVYALNSLTPTVKRVLLMLS